MEPNANYFHAIRPYLPEDLLQGLRNTPVDDLALDNLVRLISGAECSPHSTPDVREGWSAKQTSVATALSSLARTNDNKRTIDDSELNSPTKRPRLSPSETSNPSTQNDADTGNPVFTLQPISITAPIRKKVDLNIHGKALVLVNTTTKAIDTPPIPRSVLRRAFLLPTRGKTKPHWTVVILSSDSQAPTRGKQAKGTADDNPQVIFGVDAKLATPLNSTTYDADGNPTTITHPKGSETLPILREFLEHLGIQLLEPNPNVFQSAVPGLGKNANPDGVPGIEAYRSAKPGSLWFMREGILWGESKPCEFWSVEDLIGKTEGLKIIGGTGKTCSVILTRRYRPSSEDKVSGAAAVESRSDEPEEDLGEETEFSMVDSKEKEGIELWVRQHRHSFGIGTDNPGTGIEETSEPVKDKPEGPLTIHQFGGLSDSSDEDFAMESDDESSGGDSMSESGSETEGEESDEDDEDRQGEKDSVDDASGESEEEELDPKHHPLLRAGALPRMSKAVMDMAVAMVVEDVIGNSDEEVDELME